tara:strand:+ start:309 stop:1547 length:1239 start_codon:yes stop_codon:yes gene_type:complete
MAEYRASRSRAFTNSTDLWTYQDAVEHVLDTFGLNRDARNHRQARRAVLSAYRDLPNVYRWPYYHRRYIFTTDASQTTGTITYDHTGGSSERLVTLVGATWPTNAAEGNLLISDVHYEVEDYKSSTTLTLTADSNPGADVASGTSYEWYREAYAAPMDFRRIGGLIDPSQSDGFYQLEYVSPEYQLKFSRNWSGQTTTYPGVFTIRNDSRYLGGKCIVLGRPPSSARTYEFIYEASPRPLRVEKDTTSTVSAVSTVTVTASGAAFYARDHLGAVIRFSQTSTEPTSNVGGVGGGDNRYVDQRVIKSVTDTTTLVMDQALHSDTSISSGDAYVISDPLDLDSQNMLNYFFRSCEYHFSALVNRDDKVERFQMAKDELQRAIESANVNTSVTSGWGPAGQQMRNLWGDVTVKPS